MKKTIIAISLLTFSSMSQAGLNGLTIHSRANCVNNESISWDATEKHKLYTRSNHYYKDGTRHDVSTAYKEITNRSAAVHWNEAISGSDYRVTGEHWKWNAKTGYVEFVKVTDVNDCDIYNGWWDWNP